MAFKPGKLAQPNISMEMNAVKFNKVVTKMISGLTSKQGANALTQMALTIVRGIIQKNPVDTGRSRAGWYAGYNSLAAILGVAAKSPSGEAEAAGFKLGDIKYKLQGISKSISIINAVDYVTALEFGWSKQAPYGMLRVTMQMATNTLPKFILKDLEAMWKRDGVPKFTPWKATQDGPQAG